MSDLRDIVTQLKAAGMKCNCDLDNWEPERSTGHSCVCRIHKQAVGRKLRPWDYKDSIEIVCNGEVHYRRPFNDPMVFDALKTPGYSIRISGLPAPQPNQETGGEG